MIETQSEKLQSKLSKILRDYFCLFLLLPVNHGCRSWSGPFHGNRFSLGWNGWGEFVSRKRLWFQLCSCFLSKKSQKVVLTAFSAKIPRWASWRFLQRWPTLVQQDWLSLSTSQVRITLYYIFYIIYYTSDIYIWFSDILADQTIATTFCLSPVNAMFVGTRLGLCWVMVEERFPEYAENVRLGGECGNA